MGLRQDHEAAAGVSLQEAASLGTLKNERKSALTSIPPRRFKASPPPIFDCVQNISLFVCLFFFLKALFFMTKKPLDVFM